MSLYAELNHAIKIRSQYRVGTVEWAEANHEVCCIRSAMIAEAKAEEYAEQNETSPKAD